MTVRLIKLLTASFLFFCLGVALFPVFFPTKVEKKVTTIHSGSSIVRDTQVDDWSHDDETVDDGDATWEEEPEDTQPDRRVVRQDDERFDEEDVPLDAKQNVVPKARVQAQFVSALGEMRRLAGTLEKQ